MSEPNPPHTLAENILAVVIIVATAAAIYWLMVREGPVWFG